MELFRTLGLNVKKTDTLKNRRDVIRYINLKLAALGCANCGESDYEFLTITHDLVQNHLEKSRLLSDYLCPADHRIQNFLDTHLSDSEKINIPRLPSETFILDRYGLASELSLPADKNRFFNKHIDSYRIKQGILHNPVNDRRTTEGVFHIAEGGMPIPNDKKAVPKAVFTRLLTEAFKAPRELMGLPFTSSQDAKAELFVSLLIRPIVCPPVHGFISEKSMEIRFFVPGSMVSNLDFIESIFGNAGDPYLAENDAGLDIDMWTGHTGCVVIAPHLTSFTKKGLGLPHIDKATPRQKLDKMCYNDENELYNDGRPFKITCRTEEGIIITILADNYFGYCKKEVKTQISYAANLFGLCEEEHAGGALVFPCYSLGESCHGDNVDDTSEKYTFSQVSNVYKDIMNVKPEGYGIDNKYPDIVYIPEEAMIDLNRQAITWTKEGDKKEIKLLSKNIYIYPSGYKVQMGRHPNAPSWRLKGITAETTFCHKPSTVSGGGKSEISKSLANAIIYGPIFVADLAEDFKRIESIINRDYGNRFRKKCSDHPYHRKILDTDRSVGSIIRLLTPSPEFTDEHNRWVDNIPDYLRALVFLVKRFYKPEWGENWNEHFGVDIVNGKPGHEIKFGDRKLVSGYMRVGIASDHSWRTYKIRQDFIPSLKIQTEDDITASIIVPRRLLKNLNPEYGNSSVKFAINCEFRLFQRPDDAIIRGFDKDAESDLSKTKTFISNFEPLPNREAQNLIQDAIGFDKYTKPMQRLIKKVAKEHDSEFFISSDHPRIVNGKPCKNPRYLQTRPDLINPRAVYIAEMGIRMFRRIPPHEPLHIPVNAILPGRRNNPPDRKAGIRTLAVYNPIHFQRLPELFMDFISSLSGRSPSTTGAGSEGALTKRPFNALSPVIDLNNALVGYILSGYNGYSTPAGYVGTKLRIDHDISMLIPELWSRLTEKERNPDFLIEKGCLEKMVDFEYKGQMILANRLGYRITKKFLHMFFGRIFGYPTAVFNEEMLKPELQDMDAYADGINFIVECQKNVAQGYINDGSIENACSPLKALIYIMAEGSYQGKDVNHPDVALLFTINNLLESAWYRKRLKTKQKRDIDLMKRHIRYVKGFLNKKIYIKEAKKLNLKDRLNKAEKNLERYKNDDYLTYLEGTIGADSLK